jgi:hypothetical protein
VVALWPVLAGWVLLRGQTGGAGQPAAWPLLIQVSYLVGKLALCAAALALAGFALAQMLLSAALALLGLLLAAAVRQPARQRLVSRWHPRLERLGGVVLWALCGGSVALAALLTLQPGTQPGFTAAQWLLSLLGLALLAVSGRLLYRRLRQGGWSLTV